jgi:cyanate permease
MIFSFGPSMLDERGWSISAAGSVISIVLWLAVISVPLGGFLAEHRAAEFDPRRWLHRLRRADDHPAAQRDGDIDCHGDRTTQRPAGRADDEPARPRVEGRDTRDRHGHFYTLYYATMMLGPVVAGAAAKSIGQAAAAIHFGAIVLLACPILLWAFNRLPKRDQKWRERVPAFR